MVELLIEMLSSAYIAPITRAVAGCMNMNVEQGTEAERYLGKTTFAHALNLVGDVVRD